MILSPNSVRWKSVASRAAQVAACCSVILLHFGCNNATTPRVSTPETNDFQKLLDASMAELQLKTEEHKSWGLGTFDRWDIDQEVGNLVFSNDDGTTAVAAAQIIGSFNTDDNSWLWAWDNRTIVDELKVDSRQLRDYGEKHGIEKLTERTWKGTEEDAWSMAALAVKLCNAQGAYRGPAGKSFVFMTFGQVKVTKAEDAK